MSRRKRLWLLILSLSLLCFVLVAYWLIRRPKPNQNALALGESARTSAVNIPINVPVELDYLSKDDVLALRTQAVHQYPDLLADEYTPFNAIFGQIQDGLPWWGLKGYFFGSGERSIEGLSEESRFILNPYLLVAADFYVWSGWETPQYTEAGLDRPDFPYNLTPHSLQWWPGERRAEVTYNVSEYIATLNRWQISMTLGQMPFDLIAYNARDLNLNHIYVSYADSPNLFKSNPPAEPFAIPHYIHRGGSCGYPGGCNNMSPPAPAIDFIQIERLPAQATIWLWTKRPSSLSQSPDMTFIIHFK